MNVKDEIGAEFAKKLVSIMLLAMPLVVAVDAVAYEFEHVQHMLLTANETLPESAAAPQDADAAPVSEPEPAPEPAPAPELEPEPPNAPCCNTSKAPKVAGLPKDKRFAVISLLGDKLTVKFVGVTVFSNKESTIDVSEWRLDKWIEDSISRPLRENGRLADGTDGADGADSSADTAALRAQAAPLHRSPWSGVSLKGNEGIATALAQQTGADYVLVVLPLWHEDWYFHTNQFLSGYGVYQRPGKGPASALNFISIQLCAVEGATGKTLDCVRGSHSSPRSEKFRLNEKAWELSPENARMTQARIEMLAGELTLSMMKRINLAP